MSGSRRQSLTEGAGVSVKNHQMDGGAEACSGPLRPGDRFERFEILSELGRGGSAFVYLAYQEFLDRHVAIKVIPCKKESARELRRRAKAEAIVLSKLRHPNVVPVHDAAVTDDGSLIYIVMEKLEGLSLREILDAVGPLSVPEALVFATQACDAVEAAHRLGAIHRDLKPANLFVETGNHLRVLDFGVAKFLGAGFATTAKYRWHGTPLYMAPEHLQGKPVTPRSDIYALGTVLWEALAGRNPCLNGIETPSFHEIGWIQIGSVPPLLTEIEPTIPDYVARAIQRAIAKAPEHRYGSMHEFGVALRDVERRFTLECRERRLAPALRDLVGDSQAVGVRGAQREVQQGATPREHDTHRVVAPALSFGSARPDGLRVTEPIRASVANQNAGPRGTVRMAATALAEDGSPTPLLGPSASDHGRRALAKADVSEGRSPRGTRSKEERPQGQVSPICPIERKGAARGLRWGRGKTLSSAEIVEPATEHSWCGCWNRDSRSRGTRGRIQQSF